MPDLNKIIDDLSKLTVAEAADLSKQLEEKWGVTPYGSSCTSSSWRSSSSRKKMIFL